MTDINGERRSVNVEIQKTSEKLINNANQGLPPVVKDADGKVYHLRLPDPLDEFDLSAALGKDSGNVGLLANSMPLLFIESIDGIKFEKPGNYNEIRAALKRLGRNGMRAVVDAIQKHHEAEKESLGDNEHLKK